MTATIQAGAEAREDFGSRALMSRAETAAVAVAAAAKAEIEARYIMALKKPRRILAVRDALLEDCARLGFAEKARYRKPIGKGIEGPSIRFVEAALGRMGNVLVTSPTIFDDESKRIVRVGVTDLETNMSYSKDVTIEKTVERSKIKEGQRAISSRTNSEGKITYLIEASEDDLLPKEGAFISKAIRTLGLRIIPSDIVEEAMFVVLETIEKGVHTDPAGAQKRIADSFSSLGVKPSALEEYLGHELATCSPAEIADLRVVYESVREGDATWHEIVTAKRAAAEASKPEEKAAPAPDLKAALKEKQAARAAQKAAPPAASTAPAPAAPAAAAAAAAHVAEPLDSRLAAIRKEFSLDEKGLAAAAKAMCGKAVADLSADDLGNMEAVLEDAKDKGRNQ